MSAEEKIEYLKYRKIEKIKSHESVRGRAGELYRQARRSCLKKNLKLDITREWIVEKILAGHCEATGVQFNLKRPVNAHFNWDAPSLDRKDAKGGYTKDNVQVTTWRYNNAKSFMGKKEFSDFCYLVVNHDGLTDPKIVRL
jgi:hypothetical protein